VPDHDDLPPRLRVPGWLPQDEGRDPLSVRALPSASAAEAALPAGVPAEPAAFPRGGAYFLRRPILTIVAAAMGLFILLSPILAQDDGGVSTAPANPRPGGSWFPAPIEAGSGGPSAAAESAGPAASPALSPSEWKPVSATTSAGTPAPTATGPTSAGTTSPPGVALTAGSVVGLEPVTAAGYRVRHYNFTGRIDPIGSGSSAAERADATFRVRPGLAGSGCISFEAVNYPGRYLRHQNFQVYLHAPDGGRLFAQDATFCVVPGLAGRDVSLRSYNYPGHYLDHRDRRLRLDEATSSPSLQAAMTFGVRQPLI
jgi:hypothetical protein